MIRERRRFLYLGAFGLLFCLAVLPSSCNSIRASAARPEGVAKAAKSASGYDYPHARQYCFGHVTPERGQHIGWRALATAHGFDSVTAYYRKFFKKEPSSKTAHTATFNARDAKLDWVITVAKAGQPGPWTSCAMPRGTRTIVMISHRG